MMPSAMKTPMAGPELGAIDAAVETREKIFPVHVTPPCPNAAGALPAGARKVRRFCAKDQSLSSSLIEVFDRVFSSTRLTITAQ